MPAPKKKKDGPKQKKAAPTAPKISMLEVRSRYMEELPPLPYHAYPDERCFLEKYKRQLPPISDEESILRVECEKEYSRFMNSYWKNARRNHKKQLSLRRKALEQLQKSDAALFGAAIAFNFDQFPSTISGLRETLPNPQHTAPLKVSEKLLENEEAIGTNAWQSEEKFEVTMKKKNMSEKGKPVESQIKI